LIRLAPPKTNRASKFEIRLINTPTTDLAILGTIADSTLPTSTYTAETVNVSGDTLSANTMYFICALGIDHRLERWPLGAFD
jgi:hypothetical protein